MDIIYDWYKNESEDMTLDSELSTTYPPNATDTSKTAPLINCNEKIEATEKTL